ncbi:Clp protease N-terminal domain-containing protein [Nucisporomicrobium flavum]|uniref:Clp protease N-terminal domain-containing protein n=1 Tax=Nucisporomicrobium flavum TaxID=2785915 RepID=UPI0018F29113|nr:Clp protease N-terminal domain-containing protein [Nucisporomicrobium flavum]
MLERFTQAARDAVIGAQEAARDLRQSPIGTEHVLLAMLSATDGPIATAAALREKEVDARSFRAEILRRVGPGTAPADPLPDADAEDKAALKSIGIDLDAVRRAIEDTFGPGSLHLPRETPRRKGLFGRFYGSGHIPFSPRAKKVLELALREAIRLKHRFIAPEHLMLGMIRDDGGLAMQILAERGVDLTELGAEMARSLKSQAA